MVPARPAARRRPRDAGVQRQHRVRIEAGIQRREVADRTDHQSRADQQDDGQGHFRDDEGAAHALRLAAAAAARRFLQRVAQVGRLRLQPGHETDEEAAGERDGDGEQRRRAGRDPGVTKLGNVTGTLRDQR